MPKRFLPQRPSPLASSKNSTPALALLTGLRTGGGSAAPGLNRNRNGQRHRGIDPPQAVQDRCGSDGKRPPHQAGLCQRLSDEGCVLACASAPQTASRATTDRCRGLTAITPTEDQLQRNSPEPDPPPRPAVTVAAAPLPHIPPRRLTPISHE